MYYICIQRTEWYILGIDLIIEPEDIGGSTAATYVQHYV